MCTRTIWWTISNNTDIYSLGISIINALIGDEIFNQKLCGKTEIETVGKRILLPLPGINELVPGLVPKSFDGIIRKCTKKESKERISPEELLFELKKLERDLISWIGLKEYIKAQIPLLNPK